MVCVKRLRVYAQDVQQMATEVDFDTSLISVPSLTNLTGFLPGGHSAETLNASKRSASTGHYRRSLPANFGLGA